LEGKKDFWSFIYDIFLGIRLHHKKASDWQKTRFLWEAGFFLYGRRKKANAIGGNGFSRETAQPLVVST
jgi:hypothetical protein